MDGTARRRAYHRHVVPRRLLHLPSGRGPHGRSQSRAGHDPRRSRDLPKTRVSRRWIDPLLRSSLPEIRRAQSGNSCIPVAANSRQFRNPRPRADSCT